MKKIILLISITCVSFATHAQNKDSIKLARISPECYFDETNWDFSVLHKNTILSNETNCTKGIIIDMPSYIYYFPLIDSTYMIPYFSYEKISLRRKSNYCWDYTFHIRNCVTNKEYIQLLDLKKPLYKTTALFQTVYGHRLENRDQEQLEFALSKDNSVDETGQQLSLLEYLDFKLEPGDYEIYTTYVGYESNKCVIHIIDASKQTLFYPAYFNGLKMGWKLDINYEDMPVLYRGFSDVVIDVPSEIYHYPETDTSTVIPICCTSSYPKKDDILKEGEFAEVFIKDLKTDHIYRGKVNFYGRNAYGDLIDSSQCYPKNKKERKDLAKTIIDGQMCTRAFNINALDFVDMPYEAGDYEVYVKRAGYESNHMKVTIKFFYEE